MEPGSYRNGRSEDSNRRAVRGKFSDPVFQQRIPVGPAPLGRTAWPSISNPKRP